MKQVTADDGVEIAYDVWGRRDGPPRPPDPGPRHRLAGLGAPAHGVRPPLPLLRARQPWRRPHAAPTARPYSLEQMATRRCWPSSTPRASTSAHVIGASMGGVIAQIIGVLHPERTRSLVLACTACRHHPWRRELLQEWADAVQERGMAGLGDEALRWLVGPRLRKRFGIWLNLLARILVHADPEAFAAQVRRDPRRARRAALRARATCACPTLVITGSQDALTPDRRRRGARRDDPLRAAGRAARRRPRPHGRVAQRLQRRRARLPRPTVERPRRRVSCEPAARRAAYRSQCAERRPGEPTCQRRRRGVDEPAAAHTSGSSPSAPASASPALAAWSRALPSAASIAPFAARETPHLGELLGVERVAEQLAQRRARRERVDHRQRVHALDEVLARRACRAPRPSR